MPSSPRTPRHSRHPSSLDFGINSITSSPQQDRRRESRSSLQDAPSTPGLPHRASFTRNDLLDYNPSCSGGQNGGLGNLADELGDYDWDGEENEEDGYYDQDQDGSEQVAPPDISFELEGAERPAEEGKGGTRDSGVEVESPGGAQRAREKSMSLSLPSPNGQRGHKRAGSEYDGSEYGSESDLDSPGMPPSLVAKIDAVESLARRGTESNGSATDGAFKRVTEGLRDLGSQAVVEGGASR